MKIQPYPEQQTVIEVMPWWALRILLPVLTFMVNVITFMGGNRKGAIKASGDVLAATLIYKLEA